MTVPMLFVLAWLFNFLIGGLSGVFLSDVPSDVTTHGSFFSMAHFHYTIMGGLLFSFFAAIYYWVPKMTGLRDQRTLGEDPLLVDVHRVQLDLRAAARDRLPRHAAALGHLRRLPARREHLGVGLGVLPRRVDARLHRQLHLVAWCSRAFRSGRTRGGRSRSSGSCRRRCRCTTSTASRRSGPIRIPYGQTDGTAGAHRDRAGAADRHDRARHTLDRLRRRRARAAGGDGAQPADRSRTSGPARRRSSSRRSSSRTSISASLDKSATWRPKHVDPSFTLGTLDRDRARRSGGARCGSGSRTTAPTSGRRGASRGRSRSALLVASIVLQIVEWSTQGFGPTNGPYASVYLGWTGLLTIFVVGLALLGRDDACDLVPLPAHIEGPTAGRARLRRRRPDRAGHRQPRLARPAGARGGVVLRALPRRYRRHHLVHPLRDLAHGLPASTRRTGRSSGRSRRSSSPRCSICVGGRQSATASDAVEALAGRFVLRGPRDRSRSPSTHRSTRTRTVSSGCTWCSTCC